MENRRFCVLLAGLSVSMIGYAPVAPAALTNRYVVKNNPGAQEPYDAWTNAAADIQTAVNYAYVGETVLVSNGVYDTGGITNYPSGTVLTNRLAITKAIIVRSANNDPTNTIIKGRFDTGEPGASGTITNGPAAVRCLYMASLSSLIGFTLTNGATLGDWPVTNDNHYGGGAWCREAVTFSNCWITGNSAHSVAGGMYENVARAATQYNCRIVGNSAVKGYCGGVNRAILSNCILTANSAPSYGGAHVCTLYNCTLAGNSAPGSGTSGSGGGAGNSTLYNCTLISNTADVGGGAYNNTMFNCLLANNIATVGGGANYGFLYNCTVVSNIATFSGGGVRLCTNVNCIVYFNTCSANPNWSGATSFTNCCAITAAVGWASGNITNDPMFVDRDAGNFRLSNNSPCMNTGTNQDWMTNSFDLDGRIRIRYGTVDMGAYEKIYDGTTYYCR